jgi:hypothetical protein
LEFDVKGIFIKINVPKGENLSKSLLFYHSLVLSNCSSGDSLQIRVVLRTYDFQNYYYLFFDRLNRDYFVLVEKTFGQPDLLKFLLYLFDLLFSTFTVIRMGI